MPNAVLEAMAAGLPVVASAVAGNSDVVRNGKTGYLCELGDERAFRDALTELAQDVPMRHRMGHAARALVESEYSWDTVAERYASIFRDQHLRNEGLALRRAAREPEPRATR
jgi:glycosyltransferase involved in cell wall biosynthesis